VDYRSVFHTLPLRGPDTCTPDRKRDEVGWFIQGHAIPGARSAAIPNGSTPDRLYVVAGLAGSDITQVDVRTPHARHPMAPAEHGGFIAIVPGTVSIYDIHVVARYRDGSVQRFAGRGPRTPRFHVTPAAGGAAATFAVRFRSPFRADDPRDAYQVSFNHPRGACGGLRNGVATVPAPSVGDVVLSLRPSGSRWCSGRYKASVQFVDYRPGVKCSAADAKALLCSRERLVGRFFTFRVR
jgi:hypothetical protein